MLVLAAAQIALAVIAVATASPPPPASPSPTPVASVPPGIADFYTADRSATAAKSEFELRLRDDGRAWLVTATSNVARGRFETGTWRADGAGVRVDLDTTATVNGGAPADPQAETRSLSLASADCTLTLTASTPPNALGESGVAFRKRHCP